MVPVRFWKEGMERETVSVAKKVLAAPTFVVIVSVEVPRAFAAVNPSILLKRLKLDS